MTKNKSKLVKKYNCKGKNYPYILKEPYISYRYRIYKDQYGTKYYNHCAICGELYGELRNCAVCPTCMWESSSNIELICTRKGGNAPYIFEDQYGTTYYEHCQKCNRKYNYCHPSPLCKKCIKDNESTIELYEFKFVNFC